MNRVAGRERPVKPLRRKYRRIVAAGALGLAIVGLAGSQRTAAPPRSGRSLMGRIAAPPGETAPLRVGTFNIRGGKGLDGRRDLRRTAECLRSLDLVGLNEVHGEAPWQPQDQAEQLGVKLGRAWLFAPTERRWWRDSFGNGVLASVPVTHWQAIPLPRQGSGGFRNVLLLKTPYRGRTIHIAITHVDQKDDREAQLRAVIELFLSLAEPAILMGDLNSNADDPQIQRLLTAEGVEDPLAHFAAAGRPKRVEWILTRGLHTTDAGRVATAASDHPCVWAALTLGP